MNWSPTTAPLPPRTGLSQDALIDLIARIEAEDAAISVDYIEGLGPDAYYAVLTDDGNRGAAFMLSSVESWPAYRRTRALQQEARRTHSRYGAVCDV